MWTYWLKAAIFLSVIAILPIFAIRAQPYVDRVTPVLSAEACLMPCFIGIRPQLTTMPAAVSILETHEWVDKNQDEFPSLIRESITFGASIPRTTVDWRWTAAPPVWIDRTQPGSLTIENRDVLHINIMTHFTLGDVLLALGEPDAAYLSNWNYAVWYGQAGWLILVESDCPRRSDYHLPVRIRFVATAPRPADVSVTC